MPHITVGLFGASSLGRQCLELLKSHGRADAVCFFDNDSAKWGAIVDGVPVHEPSRAALSSVDVIWVTTIYADQVLAQLKRIAPSARIAHTLTDVVSSYVGSGFSRTSVPPVNIVLADQGWILEQCAREIEKRLPYIRVSNEADANASLNYYVNYSAFRGRIGGKAAAFFTHVEERSPEATTRFFEVASQVDACVAMSDRYAARLTDSGASDVRVISPGVDLDRFTPVVRIGVVGRTYKTGRKGEDLVRAVMDEPNLEWHFTGEGWPGPCRHLSDDDMPAFYRSMDYILVPAHYEGGPMPLLEALASGTEVIAPRVGFVDAYPHIEFETGNADDLRRVLRGLVDVRMARRRAVEARTWDAWAAEHDRLFRGLVGARVSPAPPAASPRSSGLKVLFALHAPESVAPTGGPSIRLPLMQQALSKYGVDVEIAHDELPDPRGYDLVHVFNVWEPSAALRQLQHLKAFDVPVVFSPIFLTLQEGLWAQRAVLPLFKKTMADSALEHELAQVATTAIDVREATGLALDAMWEQWPARVREMTALADHLIVLSEHEASALHAFGALGTQWSLAHNGTDPSWADGASPDLFAHTYGVRDYVLSVGRIEPRKNQLLLARALRDTNLDLVLIGDTPKPDYADLVARHGGRVHIVGRMSHTDPLLRSAFAGARVFALPSWSEGAPLAALEAAGVGVPMVLSDRSGEREYLGDLARYVDPLDLASMREAVLQAFEQSRDPEPHRATSRAWVSRALTWDHHARETASAYARVLSASRRTAPVPVDFTPPAPRRLEIGSGMNPQRGYEHFDARPDLPDIDHVGDMRRGLPFPDGAFDEVMSRSCIEHVSWREVKSVLNEWGRILRPGGKLDVWSPDFEYLCRQYLARKDDRHLDPALAREAGTFLGGYDPAAWAIIKMFGGQDYAENFHGAVLDEEVLTRVLQEAGFASIERREPFGGLRLWATRTPAFQRREATRAEQPVPGAHAAIQPPVVLWDSPTFNYGGYAALSRHLIRSLVPAGVSLQLRPRDDDETMRNECLASAHEGWIWARALRRTVSGGAYVCCYTPADWNGKSIFQTRRDEHRGLKAYVGLTMFETDRLPHGWREACDALDEIWVPSEFNRQTFTAAGVAADKIQVIPIGIDASRYDPTAVGPLEIEGRRGFTFLSVFDWNLRKGWDVLLRAYVQAFSRLDDVMLVLRTSTRRPGPGTRELVEQFLASLGDRSTQPAVIVLEESLAEDEMPRLYRTADAFVLPTRGEGWGLPIMEAMAAALPAIVTDWGAHLDFANENNAYLIRSDGTVPVDEEQRRQSPFYGPDHRWANPSEAHLASVMRHVFENRAEARERGVRARDTIRTSWTPERTARWTIERLAHVAPDPAVAMDAGRRAEREGRLEDAEQQYAKAAAGRPGWMLPVYNRASILKRHGQRESARQLFEDVASRGETPAQRGGAWFHVGQLAFDDSDLPTAAVAFENCLAELPDHARARAWRALIEGRVDEQAGRLEIARDAYRAAHELAADWALATYALASALKRLGQADEARTLFAEVSRTATETTLRGGAQFHIAEILAARGAYAQAVGHLESCLLETPKHTAAAQLLTMLRIRSSADDRERTVA